VVAPLVEDQVEQPFVQEVGEAGYIADVKVGGHSRVASPITCRGDRLLDEVDADNFPAERCHVHCGCSGATAEIEEASWRQLSADREQLVRHRAGVPGRVAL